MCRGILIFGGTTEGRLLAELCREHRIPALLSVVSDYGRKLAPEDTCIRVRTGAMNAQEMARLIREEGIGLVVDATHPYAMMATDNIRAACAGTGASYLRCVRAPMAESSCGDEPNRLSAQAQGSAPESGRVIRVGDVDEAVSLLEITPGTVLLTTGSKELPAFARLSGFRERVYARVLPSVPAIRACEELGLKGNRLICMQGPFTQELNEALIRQVGADFLVTKETGRAGGYEEKIQAALCCGITAIVIERPRGERGLEWREIGERLDRYAVAQGLVSERKATVSDDAADGCEILLVGVGPGSRDRMTREVVEAIRQSDVILGAPRVLKCASSVLEGRGTPMHPLYLVPDVMNFLDDFRGNGRVAILFSGDTGFYSGAKKLMEELRRRRKPFRVLPGISSISYFAARLNTSWEDALLSTAHGRAFSLAKSVETGAEKIFLLLGGENGAGDMLETLCREGLGNARVTVGENLSYGDERIRTGTAADLRGEAFKPLCLMMIERPGRAEQVDEEAR